MRKLPPAPETRPEVMGILPLTTDAGGAGRGYAATQKGLRAARALREAGADWIVLCADSDDDPGSPVDIEEELRRLQPLLQSLDWPQSKVAVETFKPRVAEMALQAGASMIIDLGGGRDLRMIETVAEAKGMLCIRHTMDGPLPRHPSDIAHEVRDELLKRASIADSHGIPRDRLVLDPGLGRGKRTPENLALVRDLGLLTQSEYPVMVSGSREMFLGRVLGTELDPRPTEAREAGALTLYVLAICLGVRYLRGHNVEALRDATEVASAVLKA